MSWLHGRITADARVAIVPFEWVALQHRPAPADADRRAGQLDGGEPRSATVVALEPVVSATLGRDDFMDLLKRSPGAVEGVLAGLAQMIRRLSTEVGDLMFLDLQGRLAKKLLELAETHGKDDGAGNEIQATQSSASKSSA